MIVFDNWKLYAFDMRESEWASIKGEDHGITEIGATFFICSTTSFVRRGRFKHRYTSVRVGNGFQWVIILDV